jgi:ABC-type glutathione transport system ATPase component
MLGLDRYRDTQIRELSTGTRRIAEIACLVALEPTCLLLDEPSSGIAQRETEALGELLRDLRRELELTLVIIEHDIPLIMGISDRIVAMADGRVIAAGTPSQVRNDPAVVDAYLGGSVTAIERSGARPTTKRRSMSNGSQPLATALAPIRGLGAARVRQLVDTFGSSEHLRAASVEEISQVNGVGPQLAARIHSEFSRGS